ncbi:MAG: hypothetical protein II837_00520 [Treponema sp.]|nr:hypothetical protein [Treponema sp.]MBQ6566707.1 hypothetical protein [Treponema sp.]
MRVHMTCEALLATSLLLLSCSVPEERDWYERGELYTERTGVSQASELFTESKAADGTSIWHFRTNDTRYIREGGYAVWDIIGTQNSTDPVTIRAIRQSGSPTEGYGLVYFYRTSQGKEYMILAMINTMQQYTVGKYAGNGYKAIIGWTHSSMLRGGYGSDNTIGLAYDAATKVFTLRLNGIVADTFEDAEKPRLTTGRNGLVVCISQFEDFPASFVDVKFSEVQ